MPSEIDELNAWKRSEGKLIEDVSNHWLYIGFVSNEKDPMYGLYAYMVKKDHKRTLAFIIYNDVDNDLMFKLEKINNIKGFKEELNKKLAEYGF